MAYLVRWQLVGRSGRALDGGCIPECFTQYGDAVTAISDFLRSYPEVCRCGDEGYWQARRSAEADLNVWVWVERFDDPASHEESVAASLTLTM